MLGCGWGGAGRETLEGQGANAPRGRRTVRTVKAVALMTRKSIGKAGFSGGGGGGGGGGMVRKLHESPPEAGWYFQVR